MYILEIISIALNSLRANKLRSSLTILGIVVGIFSIIAISTVIEMLQVSIEEGVSSLGKNTFQIQKWPAMHSGGPGSWEKFRNRKDITLDDYERLEKMIGADVASMGAEQWKGARRFKYRNKETNPNVSLCGCTIGAFPNNKWIPDEGRLFTDRDTKRAERYIVLGADVVKTLFEYVDPVGQEVWVDGHKLKVIGILESQGEAFGQTHDNFACIPITTYQSLYGKRGRSINITVMSHDRESYDNVIEKARGAMRLIRKVSPMEEDDFDIFSNQSLLTRINEMTAGVRIGSLIIAAIALLAAGVGIMNIMLVSVTERTREIGIRKAIGAKKYNVLMQFLTEAIVLCLFGGLIGIFLGVAVGNMVGSLMSAAATIPVLWVLIGVGLCVMIGVVFGTYPAYKAANLDPIEALRYE